MQADEPHEQSLREEAEALLANSIDNKTICEKIVGEGVGQDVVLITITTQSIVGKDGAPHDYVTAEVPLLGCGCLSQGRRNCAGVDYKGNTSCSKHFTNCCKDLRPLTIGKTARVIQGQIYCPFHAFMQRIWLCVRWIFVHGQKEQYFDREVKKEAARQMNAYLSQAKKNETH